MEHRQMSFAGSWYPGQAKACEREINDFLSGPAASGPDAPGWLGGIVPHAGWYFSGRIACRTIDALRCEDPIDLVVLFGMHLSPGSPNIMMAQGAWETPFGDLPVCTSLADALMERYDFDQETPRRFHPDNTIELQLPFVKRLLNPAEILAIGVPPTSRSLDLGRAVADWIGQTGKRARIIGSTDLTHYGGAYGFSPQGSGAQAVDWVREHNDRQVIEAMLAMTPDQVIQQGLNHQNACCAGAAATAIATVNQMGAEQAEILAYATSHDKSPGDSFVGYVGILFK
ncbi:MAG: AmmeMemoRadiSam system protein B [Desulfatitalea sp.]|nr:AmmeMemoRadiSam system protein B [Desulfatitalea sp.]NNJ99731.1 AmmeMemoRadiSam system protein B [Desulfatitalea sp.]